MLNIRTSGSESLICSVSKYAIFKLLRSPGIVSKESIPPAYVVIARNFKRLRNPGIDSKELIQPAYVAWRAGTTNRVVVSARQAGNRFLGSVQGLQIRALVGRYDNPIPNRFLAPVGCPKVPEPIPDAWLFFRQVKILAFLKTVDPNLVKLLKIRSHFFYYYLTYFPK
jgi:hypothetical protein